MKINGKATRTIWLADDGSVGRDHRPDAAAACARRRPAEVDAGGRARDPHHAGARRAADRRHRRLRPRLAIREDASDEAIDRAIEFLAKQRPTAINLRWALEEMRLSRSATCRTSSASRRPTGAQPRSATRTSRPAAASASTGSRSSATSPRGRRRASRSRCSPTATPAGSPASTGAPRPRPSTRRTTPASRVHVWVDETRPRNQGASLTAFELGSHGVPHTIIVDNAGGHLMQHGRGRSRHRRHRPRGGERRRRQQDRHLPEGARRGRQRRAVLRGAAALDHRLDADRRARRSPSRSARPTRS